MGKTSTLIYLYSNFDGSEILDNHLNELNLDQFEDIFKFITENTKKVPKRIVDNIIELAQDYS